MAMGENESWMTIANDDKVDWSSNIESNYPGFTKTWCNRSSKTGYVSQVILGCNKKYFIKGTGWWYWNLNDSMEKEIDIHKNCSDIDVLALGQNGSYVVQLKSGRAFWHVDGFYSGLHEWLNKKSKNEGRDIRVRLSPTRPWSSVQLMLPLT